MSGCCAKPRRWAWRSRTPPAMWMALTRRTSWPSWPPSPFTGRCPSADPPGGHPGRRALRHRRGQGLKGLKLLAIAKRGEKALRCGCTPRLCQSHPLGVQGAFNAVFLQGHASGDMMLYGKGAGALPTAGAMLSDILFALTHPEPQPLKEEEEAETPLTVTDNWLCGYYLRFMARNEPGVLGHIATRLGEHGVSIESLVQRGTPESGKVPVIVITHRAREKAVRAAIRAVDPDRAAAKSAIRLEGVGKA